MDPNAPPLWSSRDSPSDHKGSFTKVVTRADISQFAKPAPKAQQQVSPRTGITPTFLIAFHEGSWRINVGGEWFGCYVERTAAEAMAMVLAKASGELPTRVAVRERDGSEKVLWDPFSIVYYLWQMLHSRSIGSHTGPTSPEALWEEIARRVLDCAEGDISNDQVIDVVLESFGVKQDSA
jgi:hypothetical protein